MSYRVKCAICSWSLLMVSALVLFTCNKFSSYKDLSSADTSLGPTQNLTDTLIVYKSETLQIHKISNHMYQHISYLTTNDFGNVPCNGMLVINKNQAIVFDTPTNLTSSKELINYLTDQLKCSIIAVVPTHFHDDCVGGLATFEEKDIPTFASNKTIDLLKQHGPKGIPESIHGFSDRKRFQVGDLEVVAQYFGEGHTADNIIGYVPSENVIFGGCLIKEMNASKGFLGDANILAWAETVKKIKDTFPQTKIVIPGHGAWGGIELLDYTIQLFE